MIDNFNLIEGMLDFSSEDDFYFVQILQRKKDNPNGAKGSNNNARLIKAYYIDSLKKLHDMKDEMVFFATHFNARIGINLNKRSYYKTAFNTMKTLADLMHNKNFKRVRRAWNTACGVHNGGDKVWLLDIDTKDDEFLRRVSDWVTVQQPEGPNIIGLIPSRSGYHLITRGFDLRGFAEQFPEVEIHKNNPTNLYIP